MQAAFEEVPMSGEDPSLPQLPPVQGELGHHGLE